MGRHKKDLLPIMKLIMEELSRTNGLSLKSLCESMYKKHKTRKNYVINAYKILVEDDVVIVSTAESDKGPSGYFLKLSENVITRKIEQINSWVDWFTKEQKPFLKKLRKNEIVVDYKVKQSPKGYSWKINLKIEQDLRRIADHMTNMYRHISALGLAYDSGLIPKVYEQPIRKAQKEGMKFIKNSLTRIVACERKHPKALKHHLRSFFISELIELGYYEKYYEEKKNR